MRSTSPAYQFRVRALLVALLVVVKTGWSFYWVERTDWMPLGVLGLDVAAGAVILWLRYVWFKTLSPYDPHLKALTQLALFVLILTHNYHLTQLGLATTNLFFIPVMVAAFDFGARGGLAAGAASLAAVIGFAYLVDGALLSMGVLLEHVILYTGISLVAGRLVGELLVDRERYRQIVEAVQSAVIRVDLKGRVTLINRAAERLTGTASAAVVGRLDWLSTMLGTDEETTRHYEEIIGRALTEGREERGLLHYQVIEGRKRQLLLDIYVLRAPAGRPTGAFLVLRDVTDLKEKEEELREANRLLSDLTVTDSLTGLGNRRLFDQQLAHEWVRAERTGRPLSLIMLDIDHFKSLNDSHGHVAGDVILRELAGAVRRSTRLMDTAFRYGGEEFAILLPETDLERGALVAERLRIAVQRLSVHREGVSLPITISLGVASDRCHPGMGMEALVEAADRAMYQAKRDGRNCVRLAHRAPAAETG